MPLPGEIWLAEIPFTDGSASKIRPVLVLWLDAGDAVVAAVTSAAPRSISDVSLQDWQAEGLCVISTVRLSRWTVLNKICCGENWAWFPATMHSASNKYGQIKSSCVFERAHRLLHALR